MKKNLVEEWRERLFHTPDSTCFAYVAYLMMENRMYEDAFEILMKGIETNPDYIPGLITLGIYFFKKEEFEKAKDIFLKVVSKDFENIRAYEYLLKIYEKLNDKESLLKTSETLSILDPYNKEAREYLARRVSHTIPVPTVAMAELYEAQGHYDEALKIYKEILKKEPQNEEIKKRIEKIEKERSV